MGDVSALLTAVDEREAEALGASRRPSFRLGRALVRRTAAAVLGFRPVDVPLARAADGRLLLPGTGCHVSLTHTTDATGRALAGVVLAPFAVGIDAEPVRPRADGLAARILADGERLPAWPSTPEAALLTAWTAKEAALKADGLGLRQGARAARLAWSADGAFTATTPNGRWMGQGACIDAIAWAIAWHAPGPA